MDCSTGGWGRITASNVWARVVPMGGADGKTNHPDRRFQTQSNHGDPSYMLNILEAYRAAGLDLTALIPQVGIFGAEPWTNSMREEIEQAFDMHAVDIMACRGDGPRGCQ